MHLQCLPIKKNYGCAGYVDDSLPNIVYIAIWMPACIVWLYYASSSTVWWFSDHFFFCLVCGPLEKKKKKEYATRSDIARVRSQCNSRWSPLELAELAKREAKLMATC